jgi:GlpG protein
MRQAGTLPGEQEAERFADYLLTLGITTRVEKQGDSWAVWVREEERVPQAKQELEAFAGNPADPRYADVESKAQTLRREAAAKDEQARKNIVELRGRWSPAYGWQPLTMILIGLCASVALATNLGDDLNAVQSGLSIVHLEPRGEDTVSYREGLQDIRDGQVWRLVTPIFLHFGPLHLIFNLWMLFRLGGLVEANRGQVKMALLVLTSAVVSNLAQYAWSGPMFGGMSGVLYALFGYAWMKSRFDPAVNIYLPPDFVVIMIAWLFLCMTGLIGGVADAAHVGGLVAGVIIGYAPVAWRKLAR